MSLDPLLTPGSDFLAFDFLEPVTYRVRGAGEVFTDVPGVQALHRQYDGDEAQFAGKDVTVWHLLISALPGPAKPRDRVKQADGTEWVVVSTALQTFATRYRLVCVKVKT
jgi:hypothetical protein